MMKALGLTISGTALILLLQIVPVQSKISGAPAGHTGSPGDGQSCNVSGCHTGAQTSAWVFDLSNSIPASGYVPGQTYTFTVFMTRNSTTRFGFQCSPQDISGNLIGTLIVTNTVQTQLNGNGKYVTHTQIGTTGPNVKTWSFDWQAPAAGSGPVVFYSGFNYANNNFSPSGDFTGSVADTVVENTSVGLLDMVSDVKPLLVYPNPVRDELQIVLNSGLKGKLNFTLFQLNGEQMLQWSNEADAVFDPFVRVTLPENIRNGVYLLKTDDSNHSFIERILVMR